ncbi:MAG: aminotransferase class I/II-fold pyridoxal phosphate-dependent enzyme, partial [Myxococcales bacterium]|nr:aminotransferase class I/II-fold pyridoxal phosphate-dependent enzyme [Myxococcales bacterium]
MEITLERKTQRDGRPVYQQIADQIREAVAARRLEAGMRLPPIRELAKRLGVNRDTVAVAYEVLARSGLVKSTVGRGTFVTDPPPPALPPPFEPVLSSLTERLLVLERSRPRFGSAVDAVPMHALIPDPSLYPTDAFRKSLNRAILAGGPELFLYGGPQGHPHMREVLAKRLCSSGVQVSPDELVLCHGASQGIGLALRLFAEPGDLIAVEEPTYNNVL